MAADRVIQDGRALCFGGINLVGKTPASRLTATGSPWYGAGKDM